MTVKTGEAQVHLSEVCPESELFVVNSDLEQHYCTVVCFRDSQQDVLAALRDLCFSITSFQGMTGMVRDNIEAGENRLRKYAEEKAKLSGQIAAIGGRREHFRLSIDRMSAKIAGAEAAERLLNTGSAFALEGWMPAEKEKDLTPLLEKYDCAWELEDPKPEEYPDVPVQLRNNRFTRPLSLVTEMYSLPAYDGT